MKKGPAPRSFNEVGFTLMEILIVFTLLVIIATASLFVLNPWGQINKGQDNKRKQELSQLNKILEDWYNDKQCYPTPTQICYDTPVGNTCHICGNHSGSPDFTPYLSRLPCDPLQPNKQYLYQFDGHSCPSWYIIYSALSNNKDPVISEVGCQNGCGPVENVNFNFLVSSPNINVNEIGVGPTAFIPPPTTTPTPAGSYYCQSYSNCSHYDIDTFICLPNFPDPFCTGSSGCTSQIGTCVRK